ncbi:hypothetical protein [Propionimicrobium sp. PCR01-08-3]|uniref:ABC transporter permease n=1 Tax=Propionimicrobium sp. PCR01-08-3 TaxID=3052086 RepID=UPI00255CF354|nr:hypothetical protein [Propionimicrobium sp. PCR01-08-3]WIY82510.1 hypothetical protein QQ658_13560 [Propionimicrobium sp. PCR01-08-3]
MITGTTMLARAALKKDRLWLTIWTLGVAAGALICASNISSGYGDEAQRAAALQAAINSPVLLIGRGLPMGPGEGAFLFYTYGVIFATIFAIFGIIFAIRHGRAEEDDGTRELLRACATGRVAGLSAAFISGTIGTAVVAFGLVAGLIAGGADVAGSLRAGGVCASVGLLFIAVGALCGQLASTARLASGLGAGLVAMLFLVRVVADVNAEVDPLTLVADPGVWGWLTPFTLVQLANPYGSLDLAPVMAMIAVTVACGIVAALVERQREFGASLVRPRPGPAHGGRTLRSTLGLSLRLQRGTLIGMSLAGFAVGGFAAALAALAWKGGDDPVVRQLIESLVGTEGPLYDVLLSYVMVLVGECGAIAGVLAVLRARREEATGNAELIRGAAIDPTRWLASVLVTGLVSIGLVLLAAWCGATCVYLAQGMGWITIWQVLGASFVQLPAAALHLGLIGVVFAVAPRLTSAFAWAVLGAGVVLAELGGRLGLPAQAIALSPFVHTPLVTTTDPRWGGAIIMVIAAVALAGLAIACYRRRDLSL